MGRRKKTENQMLPVTPRKNPILRVSGMHDILPDEQPFWLYIRQQAEKLARAYGFQAIDTPVLERTELFSRGVGADTDIVEKEMYTFRDKSNEQLSLKPEGTAGIMRAYLENGLFNKPQPVKLYNFLAAFRRERPQAGRFRQHHQIDLEVIGDKHPVVDAEIILLTMKLFERLGLKNIETRINSVGCPICRPTYKDSLVDYFHSKQSRLCPDCKCRLKKNPLRILDCKEEKCQRLAENAPQIVDFLCDVCKEHFKTVLEFLDELEIPYNLNTRLVRGLDYYTKTVFEIWQENATGSQGAICGGGRYDNLAILIGGRDIPAMGVAIGIERLIQLMREQQIAPPPQAAPDVFLVQLGELAKKRSLKLFAELEQAGISIVEALSRGSIKSQLKLADKMNVRWSLILGQKEAVDNTILIRDMESGIQEIISFDKVVVEIEKRLLLGPRKEGVKSAPRMPEEYGFNKEEEIEEEENNNLHNDDDLDT